MYVLHRSKSVVRLDAEIHRRLVVLLSGNPAVNGLAVDEQAIAAQGRDGAEFALGEDGVGGLEQDVLELSAPRLVAVIEDLDAPDLVCGQGAADRFVDLPVSLLTFFGLQESFASVWCATGAC